MAAAIVIPKTHPAAKAKLARPHHPKTAPKTVAATKVRPATKSSSRPTLDLTPAEWP